MSTELTKKPTDLKGWLNSDALRSQIAAALPKHLTAERFCRVAITALTRTPKLADCTQESFFKCLFDLSAMGLEPDGRRAHLIPYGKECTLVIDYKGLVELIRRSGDVAKIHADVVCENDTFEHSMGEVTVHTYDLRKPRGEAYAAYAQVTLKDGSVQAEIMGKAEIEQVRSKSRAGKSGPWVDHWEEMAKKTAFRRLTKWLTLSPEVQDRIAKADEHEFPSMRNATPPSAMRALPEPLDPFEGRKEAADPEEDFGGGSVPPSAAVVCESPEVDWEASGDEPPHKKREKAAEKPLASMEADAIEPITAYVDSYKKRTSKPGAEKPWTLHIVTLSIGGREVEATTFDAKLGEVAEALVDQRVKVELKDGRKGKELVSIEGLPDEEYQQEAGLL